jgi:hypothetical protein
MPRVGWVEGAGWVGFEDGRHTFAALRDMGKKKAFVSVDPSQVHIFRSMFVLSKRRAPGV